MDFVEKANLPTKQVEMCILGEHYSIAEELNNLGIRTIMLPNCHSLDKAIANHIDMIACHLGSDEILLLDYNSSAEQMLTEIGMNVELVPLKDNSNRYPNDVQLNGAIVGDCVICNAKHTHKRVQKGKIIDVKQGYAKCNTLVVQPKAIITSDKSIASAYQYDCLLIESGGIELIGYDYGFIGGCGCKIDEGKMYFTGKVSSHKNSDDIKKFLHKYGVEVIEGKSDNLIDIGSIIPIK